MPTSNYVPSSSRSVSVIGEFSEDLAAGIIPLAIKLREESIDPITVYIHSRGGQMSVLEALLASLRNVGTDNKESRIITMAVGDVASAGAFLLSLGNYAYAYPESTILYHGVRFEELKVTVERETAQGLLTHLDRMNRRVSRRIAQSILPRVMFRFLQIRAEFNKKKPLVLEPEQLLLAVGEYMSHMITSPAAKRLLKRTLARVNDACELTRQIISKVNFKVSSEKVADSRVLRALLKHELKNAKDPDWRLDESGMSRLVEDYFLLREYNFARAHDTVFEAIDLYGQEFLNETQRKEYSELKGQKALEYLFGVSFRYIALIWYFTATLSNGLFIGDNELRSIDAYWLGLIDEIIGSDLECERLAAEKPDKTDTSASPSTA